MLNFRIFMDCSKLHECELCEKIFACEYDKYLHNSWVRKTRVDTIRKVILVNASKGGLGATSFSISLASVLAGKNLRTALLETSFISVLPDYLGHDFTRGLEIISDGIIPSESKYGFKYLAPSLFMQKERQPLFWESEVAIKFIKKMIVNTNFGELDVLVLDVSSCQTSLIKDIKNFLGEKLSNAVLLVDFKDHDSQQSKYHESYLKSLINKVNVLRSPSKDIKVKDKHVCLPLLESLLCDGSKPFDVIKILEPYSVITEEVIKTCL